MLRVISACVIGAIVALVFPVIFGEEYGTRQMARIIAPFVGASYESTARDENITVLLVDDQALMDAGEPWPPSYDFYAKILNDVANYTPRAVFVDLIFSTVRQDAKVKELCKVLKAMKKRGTEVFLAASLDDKGWLTLRKGLNGVATKVAVEYNPDDLDRVVWTYPMTRFRDGQTFLEDAPGKAAEDDCEKADEIDAGSEASAKPEAKAKPAAKAKPVADAKHAEETKPADEKPARSAALAIYEDVFKYKVKHPEEALALTWGLFPVHDGLRWTRLEPHDDAEAAGNEHDRKVNDFGENYDLYCNESDHVMPLIAGAISHALVAKRGRPICVFHHTLYLREMLYPNESQSSRLDRLLSHRVVMIGSAFSYSNDIVFSPLHDRVPGVYLHAMALDNLITHGPDYARSVEFDEPKMTGAYPRVLLLIALGGVFVYILTRIKERWLEGWKEKCRPLRKESEPVEIDETLVATAHEPGAGASEPGRDTHMAVRIRASQKRTPRISPSERFFGRLMEGGALTMLKLLEVAASLAMVGVLVFAGQWMLNVPYLAIAHVTLFALVAEWFEWNRKLNDWYFGEEDKS